MLRLYHGSQDEIVIPQYGKGEEHHDFGKGFYLTDQVDLAKEWSVNRLERLFADVVREIRL